MKYEILIVPEAIEELNELPMHVRRRIATAIERDLTHEPATVTRNRKPLPGLSPSFAHVPPVWELRIGDYRVFYDIEHEDSAVSVRAVRFKGQSTTGEIT